jgi:hypothetical protein
VNCGNELYHGEIDHAYTHVDDYEYSLHKQSIWRRAYCVRGGEFDPRTVQKFLFKNMSVLLVTDYLFVIYLSQFLFTDNY